jgi:hypothetical protein|tara:strand:+ start:5127 stop:6119 length:993 start_codon:yes stop_codon:yes gene_type:complete
MALKSATIQIFIYSGTQGSYSDSDLKYTISKERISSKSNILFEIANLVRDYITHEFNNDYPSATQWVTVVQTLFDSDTNAVYATGGTVTNHYVLKDGFGDFEDEINPQLSTNCLITSDNIYLPEGTAGKIPIFAEGVGKYVIGSTTTQVTDSGNSNQKIQYIAVPADTTNDVVIYATNDSDIVKTIKVNLVCEPKFTSYKVTFVNKYGAYEDFFFFKKTTERFSVTDEIHKRNNINTSSVSYATNKGQRERYGVNAVTTLEMNTGYILENAVSSIEEMFLSENVWIRFDGKTLPVIPKSKSFVQKTGLNDKLINYTVQFEFAFNLINNIR